MWLPQLSQGFVILYSSVSLKGEQDRAAEKGKGESYETIFHACFPVAQEALAVAMAAGARTPPPWPLGLPALQGWEKEMIQRVSFPLGTKGLCCNFIITLNK